MSQDNVEIVRRNNDAYNRRDLDAYFETVSESVTFQSRFSAMDNRVYRGPDEMRRYFRELDEVWARYEMRVERLIAVGAQVAGLFHLHAIGRGSQVELEEDPGVVFTVRDGKVVQIDAYKTHAEALEAVGLRETMSQENVEIVRRYYSAWNAGGIDAARAFWSDEIEWHDAPDMPDSGVYRGAESVAAHFRDLSGVLGGMEVHVDRLSPAGDEVLVLLHVHLDTQRGGMLLEGPIYETVRIEQGKVSRIRLFLDERDALEAVGLRE